MTVSSCLSSVSCLSWVVTWCLLYPWVPVLTKRTHLLRVWEMWAFYWIPNQKLGDDMHFPAIYWDFSYRRQAILEPIDPKFWHEYENVPIDGLGFVDTEINRPLGIFASCFCLNPWSCIHLDVCLICQP